MNSVVCHMSYLLEDLYYHQWLDALGNGWLSFFDCFFLMQLKTAFFFSLQYKIDSLYFKKDKRKQKWKTQGHQQQK